MGADRAPAGVSWTQGRGDLCDGAARVPAAAGTIGRLEVVLFPNLVCGFRWSGMGLRLPRKPQFIADR
ncbi:hypothetical protein, partial [Streptomyces bungoensis]|uniref:hypothetical protein n=1 Tax=Streptomyces bungoensis TaxID=285568 RepID=UPI0033E58BDF